MARTRRTFETPITQEEAIKRRRIIKNVEKLIKIVGGLLIFFFGWLNFKDFPYISLLNDNFSSILLKTSLAIYYTSWVLGISTDLKDEESTLLIAPNKGKLTSMAISIIFIMGGMFAVLCWATNFKLLSISLFAFLLIDRLSNLYLNRYIKDSVEMSKEKYLNNKNYSGYLSLNLIHHFLSGSYIKWRFGTGFFLISIFIFLSFTNFPELIANYLQIKSPQLILSAVFFIYVITIEIWIWFIRFRRKVYYDILEEIEQEYKITKK